jgi:hypothetical protein
MTPLIKDGHTSAIMFDHGVAVDVTIYQEIELLQNVMSKEDNQTPRQQNVPFESTVHYHSIVNNEFGPEKVVIFVVVARDAQTSLGRRVLCLSSTLPFLSLLHLPHHRLEDHLLNHFHRVSLSIVSTSIMYRCRICQQHGKVVQSASKGNFMTHLGTVHNMGPYCCSVCPYKKCRK